MKSKAELRIAARVRSDLPILDTACGLTCNGDDVFAFFNIMFYIIDTVSFSQDMHDISPLTSRLIVWLILWIVLASMLCE